MFNKVSSSLFSKSLQNAGVRKQVEAAQSIEIVKKVFADRFGDGAGLHATPKYIKNRTVAVLVAHPAVGEEIKRQEEAVISEINKQLGRPEVLRIQFILATEEGLEPD